MTVDERRANEAMVRGLRESLNHNLPADMRQGIRDAIAYHTGEPQLPPPPLPTNSLTNRPITFETKVTINGEPLSSNPWSPF